MISKINNKNLSIIIPHYNSLELLGKLIESIPSRDDIEILLIDDNSPNARERLQAFAEERPKQISLFYNESGKNSAGTCRNIGLDNATGKWLLFADADDYFMPGFYEKVAAYFESAFDIIWFIPTSRDLDFDKAGNRHIRYETLVRNYLKTGGGEEELKLRYNQKEPFSKLIRRQIVEDNGIRFDSTLVSNDVMFSMRTAYVANKISATEEIIYCVTKMQGTLTTNVNEERFYIRMNVFLKRYWFLKQNMSRKEWNVLGITGRTCIQLAKNYGLSKNQIRKVYFYLLRQGVRIHVPRRWNVSHIVKKLKSI